MTQAAPAEAFTPAAQTGESIAAELAARTSRLAAVPGDAMDWAALGAAYEREAHARRTEGVAAAALFHQAGRIHEERLGSLADALARYRAALEVHPAHRPSLEAARRVAHALGDAEAECQLLEAEAAIARDGHTAAALHLARSELLCERLGRSEAAREALAQAAAADPDSLAVAEAEGACAAAERRYEDLVAAYECCAERVEDPALAAAWLCGAADVAEARLGRVDRATGLAMRAFDLAPTERAVREVARRLAERSGRIGDLARVLESDALAPDASRREAALAWCSLARLSDEPPGRAAAALEQALQMGEADPLVLHELARAHEARADWERLAHVLRRRAAVTPTSEAEREEIVRWNLRLGEICEERLGRPDEAAACYRAALALEPSHRGALAALGRLYGRAGDWERVLDTFLAQRAASVDPEDRAQRSLRAAQVLEEHLSRPSDAIPLYEEVLSLQPGHVAAHTALERLYERTGRFDALASLIERDVAPSEPVERLSLLFRLARLHEDRLGDRETAARTYERILQFAPDHVMALDALAVLDERLGRFDDLVTILERLAALTGDVRKVIALLQRAAEVQESQLGDQAAAAATHERIIELDPTHVPSLRALGRFFARKGRWEDLVAMYRAEADVLASADGAAALHARAGAILETKLDRPAEAAEAYRQALALVPSDVTALRALARLGRERSAWESLVEVLRAQSATTGSAERRAALLVEAGEILEHKLRALPRAGEVYEDALRASPSFGPALRALDRVFTATGRFDALLSARRTAAAAAPAGAARAAALLDCARLAADRLGDSAAAVEACHAALEEAPWHLPALLLLGRLQGGLTHAGVRKKIAARLRDRREAASLLVGAALRFGDGDGVEDDLARAAAAAPGHPVAVPLAETALRRAGEHAARAEIWQARVVAAADAEERGHCALRAGEAWEDAGQGERALLAFRDALDALTPGALAPLHGLRRIRARTGAFADVRAALQEEGSAARDPALAASAFSAAGEIALSRLADRAGAAADWRRALERDPLDDAMAERLRELLVEDGSHGELCALHELRARAQGDARRRAEELLRAAEIAADVLGDAERALADVDEALAATGDWVPALLARARVLAAMGRPHEAAHTLATCLALGGDPGEIAQSHLALEALYRGPLADPARAMSHLNAAVSAAPEDPEALSRLVRVHRHTRNWPAAADALRRLSAAQALGPAERAHALLELAEVRAEGFGDPAGARELSARALELAPGDAALRDRAARLQEVDGSSGGVVAALRAAASAAPPGPDRARAHLRAARVLSGALGDDQLAVSELKRALQADPENTEARATLAEIWAGSDPPLAIEEHRRLLASDPARIASWRALYALFRTANAHDRAFVVAGVLRFLQSAAPALDGAFYAENALHAPSGTSQVFMPGEWMTLRHPDDGGPLAEVVELCGGALAEAAGLHPGKDRLKGAHALAGLLEELCVNLDVGTPVLRPAEGVDVLPEPGPHPIVRIGREVARRRSLGEQRFVLARAAAHLRNGSELATRVTAPVLGELVAAAVRQVVPGYDVTGSPPPALVKAVGRALPRRIRKELDGPARALAKAGSTDVAAWQVAAEATAERAGLLLALDIPAALSVVARERRVDVGSGPAEVAAGVRGCTALGRLLCFTISDEHLRLRKRLRLAIA